MASNPPIFIASPVQRCGTTLIQRLLSSSSDTLIFGESVANDVHIYASLYQNKQLMIGGPHNAWRDQQLAQVLEGDVNAWIPDLLPARDAYLASYRKALLDYCDFLQQYVETQGRSGWGCKLPGWPIPQLDYLQGLIPGTKVIYIHRDLEACVVSARSINMCLDEPSTQQFRQMYAFQHAEAERRLQREAVMWIDYKELVEHPDKVIAQLVAFTGIDGIDAGVMAHKIGNYPAT
ncbi:sulfotransferase family protein [Lewinella cohaerens]|uniref:sulfotransferase family protein n=1 Tax=Lewinella cohaerens TaxID=70995 RepID=UPI00037CBCC8|nr:sulfotransferase [Lewinella cohaerens]